MINDEHVSIVYAELYNEISKLRSEVAGSILNFDKKIKDLKSVGEDPSFLYNDIDNKLIEYKKVFYNIQSSRNVFIVLPDEAKESKDICIFVEILDAIMRQIIDMFKDNITVH